MFYAKCKTYRRGCDWLIRASLIQKKACWEIQRYNGRHTCSMRTISQDQSKLDSGMIAEAMKPLVESNPSIKVKSIITEVQARFNYTISYRKAWLAKQKSIAKVFSGLEKSYQDFPLWFLVMVQKMSGSQSTEAYQHKRAGYTFFEFATHRIYANMQRAGNIVVHQFDRRNEVFEVRKMPSGKVLVVVFVRRRCDYSHFQVEQLPCHHVIACCVNRQLDWQMYVTDVYKMSEIRKVYIVKFVPLGDMETWPDYSGPTIATNSALRRKSKGRPKSTRYLNEMDSRKMPGPRGHSRSRCPQRAGPGGVGGSGGS
ncbi:hypothetical protein Ahy_B07g087319 [Arachis hypogaea]|uniref:SWIM-type domain-containing protein n=1 Tax=Arachis hypogaea TaxID=3818 RepID=A0A444YBP7_ARAHY|nr:hypothetical protein Ahy_B07g087319 [Arachis hypogaea]